MTTNIVETESTQAVVTENTVTNVIEVTSAGPAGPPGGALTIQDEGVDEGLLTDKINFVGSTVSVVNDTEAEIATITVNAADPGANTNITSLGGITGGISSPDYVQFDTAASAAGAVGRLLWNDTDGTLEFQLKGGNVTLQIGQEQVVRVTNKSGVTMTDGQAVYITGSTGNHLNVTLAQANTEATSSKTLAIVTETIANNGTGFATSAGLVRGLNTSALTEGAAIWLSATVPGGLTTIRPTAPDHAVLIGWCVRQSATVGAIFVHIANGYELDELHDVLITAASNNQVLRYDAVAKVWKNATVSPTLTLTGDVSGSATFTDLGNATLTATVADDSHNHIIGNVDGLQAALDSKLPAVDYNAADVLTKLKTVDGAGSGLDADLLDGQSSAYYTAINDRLGYTAENAANKGVAGGYASLDGAGLVPSTQLPSYVDDVLEFANLAAFPVTGETGKIYVAVDTSKTYRWSGSTYVEISASPGSTDAVPEGSTNLYFTTARARQSISAAGSLSYDSATGVVSYTTPNTDGIAEGTANLYHTTARARGAVSAGTGISYNSSTGVITNAAPDQTVAITGSGTTTVTGTYPNFTVSSADQYVGTVTSVSGTGTVNGLTLTGSVTSSGSLTLGGTLSVDLSTATVTGTLPITKGGTGTTSLTSGYLVKGNGTSAASASVVYDNGTNIGIGTTAPSRRLDVRGGDIQVSRAAAGVDGDAAVYFGNGGNNYIYGGSSTNLMAFAANGSERMRIGSAGNVGIGTSSPSEKLDVNGVIKGGVANGVTLAMAYNSAIRQSGTSGGTMYFDTATGGATQGAFEFRSSNAYTSRMYIDSSGNVGIGTTSLSAGYGAGKSVMLTNQSSVLFQNASNTWNTTTAGGAVTYYSDNNLYIDAKDSASNIMFRVNGATERMRIDGSGNVGIGTSAPGYKLDISGSGDVTRLTSSTTSSGMLMADSGGTIRVGTRSGAAIFDTGGSERMRIDSSGNLLVGTTTTFGKLSVYGTTGFNADANAAISGSGSFKFRGTASGTTITTYDYLNYTAIQFIRDNGNPTNTVGSITCTDGSTSYNTSSDRRLKKDIVPAGDAGSVIDAIEIVSHGWKASEGTVPFGVIAQDLHAVAPQAVHAGDDGEDVSDVWGVDYSKLVPMLVKEIQSLRARVAQLEGN